MPIIRPALLSDTDQINKIYVELFAHMANLQPDYYRENHQDPKFIIEMITASNSVIFVAEENDNILGFIIAQQQQTPDYQCIVSHSFAYIFDFVVTKQARNLGIGQSLMKAVNNWAIHRNLDYIELSVLSNNDNAKLLYEKIGFSDVTTVMRYSINPSN